MTDLKEPSLIELSRDLQHVLVFDCETTGVDEKAELLQLSITDGLGETLFNRYLKPQHTSDWPQAEAVHHISPLDVVNCESIQVYLPELQKLFDNARLLVGYNVAFDLKFVKHAGIKLRNYQYIFDVMLEFAPIYGDYDQFHQNYRWQKLATCVDYLKDDDYRLDSESTFHDSLFDTKQTAYCMWKLIKLKQAKMR